MRHDFRSRCGWSFVLGLCTCAATAAAQTNAGPLLAQINQAVSGGLVINNVVLQGNAKWYAGSLEDSGAVTLTASSSGTFQAQIVLSKGSRFESQSGQGSSQSCTWVGADGSSHAVNAANCWKPFISFLPAVSLQTGLLPANVGFSDLGNGVFNSTNYRHLQGQIVLSDTPLNITTLVMQSSTTDIWLDSSSLLPAALTYTVQPDGGSSTPIAIQIQYSNYTVVNGVQIPFRLQRYVNGVLQLDVIVSNVQIN